jgi:acyl-CoA synthetase (AMP-forming)/AMP-acid ligase II
MDRWSAGEVLDLVDTHRMPAVNGVAAQIALMLRHPDFDDHDFSCVQAIVVGAGTSPPDLVREARQRFGAPYSNRYSSTESGGTGLATALDADDDEALHTVGRPRPGIAAEVRDLEGRALPAGDVGELWLHTPTAMSGYWRDPERTADALVDGWLRTGDVGYMDEEGHFFLVDRLKDLILCSGYNVYPRMVEEAIYLHSAVSEVTVIGIKDEYRGESPKAFVKLKPGESLNETDLKQFLEDKLSKIEMPSHIEFRDELPKTIIGKLSKKELVAEEQAQQA